MSTKVHPEFVEKRRRELAKHYSCYVVYTDLEIPFKKLNAKREVIEKNVLSLKEFEVTALTENHAKEIAVKMLQRDYNKKVDIDYKILDVVFQCEYTDPINELFKNSRDMKIKSRRKTTK